MKSDDLTKLMRRYVVNIAITPSSLRNQGAKGIVEIARQFGCDHDWLILRRIKPSNYLSYLDKWTISLLDRFPDGARNWGAARKALNIILLQSSLNFHLRVAFGLERLVSVLEVPLDSSVAKCIRRNSYDLPRWRGVKNLTRETSDRYQDAATHKARSLGIPRAFLDLHYWRPLVERVV